MIVDKEYKSTPIVSSLVASSPNPDTNLRSSSSQDKGTSSFNLLFVRYIEDKTQYRTGIVASEELCAVLKKEADNARKLAGKEKIASKTVTTLKELKEALDCIRGAIMIAYPAYHGLPEWEPVYLMLENKIDFADMQHDVFDYYNPKETQLWWAGKELLKGKTLADYVGKNDKTKIVRL
jgi:cilia- and flagella-associated protein 298